jgi:pimeloyl-ACP methyl ester carboxylesterase
MQVEVNGVRLGYEMEGHGPPVVLIHGFPLSRAMWRPQVEALRDRFTVILPDLRGFGESDVPQGDLTMDTYADDVLGLLDALGYDRVALGGCSMGGYVAFRIVARAAARIRALLIADSRAGADSDEGRERRHAAIRRIHAEGPEGFLSEFTAQLVGPTTKARRPAVLEAVRQIVGTPPASSLTTGLAAMATRPDSRPLLASVTVPTLVVVGEEDTSTPPAAAESTTRSRKPSATRRSSA